MSNSDPLSRSTDPAPAPAPLSPNQTQTDRHAAPDLSQQLQSLESTINSKFAELQTLLQQHDKSTKQILKSHQNSVKQSVKAQLEKSHAEQRRYIDEALSIRGGDNTNSASREEVGRV